MARLPGVPDDVVLLQGPLLLGYLFNFCLLGVLIVQIYIYYINFPNDRASIKALVWCLFFVDCLASAFSVHAAWTSLGAGWGDLEALIKPAWSFSALPPLCGLVAMMVQLFFCWRIFVLGKITIFPVVIATLSITQCVSAFYTGVQIAVIGNLQQMKLLTSYIVMLGASGLCDVIIAITMVTFLFKARTSFHDTNDVLNKLITLTVETGMITALATITEIILLVVYRHNNTHFIVCLMLGKLYSNTLLATLNTRAILRTPSQTSQQYNNAKKVSLWDDEPNSASPIVGSHGVHVFTSTESRKDEIVIERQSQSCSLWSVKAEPTDSKNAY